MVETIINIMLYLSYIMFFVGLVAAIVLPIWKSLDDPKSLIKPIGALVGIIVLFLICWAISSGDLNSRLIQAGATEGVSKFVGGGLITMYVLFIAALVGIVYTEINKAIK